VELGLGLWTSAQILRLEFDAVYGSLPLIALAHGSLLFCIDWMVFLRNVG
jgi:hypothetical protein